MRIKELRPLPLIGGPPEHTGQRGADTQNMHTLIEVITDDGVVGLGSIYTSGKLVRASLDVLRPLLIGESANEPVRVSEKLHQTTIWQGYGGAITHTISGIDIALWDIFGKTTNQPISRLLGGRYRNRIKPYASLLMSEPDSMAASLEAALQRGFKAIKIGWGPFGLESRKKDEAIIRAARQSIGPDVELMVDAGGSDAFWPHGYKWALNTAEMLKDHDVAWLEEPLRPEDFDGYVKLTEHAPIPISGCEVLTRRQSFVPWIEKHAVDYVQPDVTKVGGVSEAYRIACHAYDHSVLFVPHGWNTALGLAADLQMVAALPTARWVEYMTPSPFIDDLIDSPFKLDDEGLLEIPNGPGLGVTLSPEGVKRHTGMLPSGSV